MRGYHSGTWDQHLQWFDDYVQMQPELLRRFHERLDGAVDADGSIESVTPVLHWFSSALLTEPNDPAAPLPVWWDPAMPTAGDDSRQSGLNRTQLAMIDETTAYVCHVALTTTPGAHWVIWKGQKIDSEAGKPQIQYDDSKKPTAANSWNWRNRIYTSALDALKDPEKRPQRTPVEAQLRRFHERFTSSSSEDILGQPSS